MLNTEVTGTGLIADTHGRVSALSKAIEALALKNIYNLIHLGDFFDSAYREKLSEVLLILQNHQILAVKGNNDYQVEKMLERDYGYEFRHQKETCLAFLKKTPIFYVSDNTCFSHSMPYHSIRSFYEPIDTGTTEKASDLFEKTLHHVLFCGHSHRPVFFRYAAGKVTREEIFPGQKVSINLHERYIFIVGSAENGDCGLYNKEQSFYERIVF